jgi:hypothetical protein
LAVEPMSASETATAMMTAVTVTVRVAVTTAKAGLSNGGVEAAAAATAIAMVVEAANGAAVSGDAVKLEAPARGIQRTLQAGRLESTVLAREG